MLLLTVLCCAEGSCVCAVLHTCQVEFEGSRHHMSLDRDVITSLELLAPSR